MSRKPSKRPPNELASEQSCDEIVRNSPRRIVAFLYQNLMLFQLQLTKDQKALPPTRDYMHDAERELRRRDSPRAPAKRRRTGRLLVSCG